MKKQIQISIPAPCHENWFIIAISFICFMGFGIYNAVAQTPGTPIPPMPFNKLLHGSYAHGIQIIGPRMLEGIITNAGDGVPLANITLYNKRTLKKIQTDSNGIYTIEVALRDTVEVTNTGYTPQSICFNGNNLNYIVLEKSKEN